MKMNWKFAAMAVAVLGVGASVAVWADDEDHLAKTPAAVQATVKSIVGQNKLAGCDPEQENGKTVYEISYELKGGGDYTVVVAEDGSVLEREVEVDPSIVPADVIAAAKTAHPDGTFGEDSIVNSQGKLLYEIETKVGKDTHEVKLSAEAKVLSDTVAPPETPSADEKPEPGEKADNEKGAK